MAPFSGMIGSWRLKKNVLELLMWHALANPMRRCVVAMMAVMVMIRPTQKHMREE